MLVCLSFDPCGRDALGSTIEGFDGAGAGLRERERLEPRVFRRTVNGRSTMREYWRVPMEEATGPHPKNGTGTQSRNWCVPVHGERNQPEVVRFFLSLLVPVRWGLYGFVLATLFA